MLFLWIFGNNVEDSMGPVKFVVFYLLGGIAATALQTRGRPGQPTVAEPRRVGRGRRRCSAATCCCSRAPGWSR